MAPVLIVAVLFLITFGLSSLLRRRRFALPPGPKGLPIVGNLFNRPTSRAWLYYGSWSDAYNSDVVSMEVLGQPVIILNSAKAAMELLEKRSAIYADKPSALRQVNTRLILKIRFPYVQRSHGLGLGLWFHAILR